MLAADAPLAPLAGVLAADAPPARATAAMIPMTVAGPTLELQMRIGYPPRVDLQVLPAEPRVYLSAALTLLTCI
ncbi:MAG: hypothetical protein ACLPTJ_13230 [Solirubrobacteraceae bacterium]